ncbi:general secretion pathway protein GspB [Arenimonas metalli]|uniref:general secretion pathway protein GspB n=1 Tax=Arenimonas metalli TaxID=948077 RepID=UPI000A02BF16|nr:general secretion pathway protein GspB [Arenimonas metalli]
MSLILEALRKSEAERQRGRAPGLFVEQVASRPKAPTTMPAWAWLLGALLLATLAFLTWRELSREERNQVHLTPPTSPESSPVDAGQAPLPGAPPAAPAPSAPSPATSLAASAPQDRSATEPPAPMPASATTPSTTTETAGTAIARNEASERRPTPAAEAATGAQEANLTPFTAPAAERGDAVVQASVPPEEVNLTPLPAESLPTLASLDAGTRAQLPPLKLSMHVFAEAPAQRFVILDGQRLGEGASPAAGIVLEEIRREGLVISVNGQRLLLARP